MVLDPPMYRQLQTISSKAKNSLVFFIIVSAVRRQLFQFLLGFHHFQIAETVSSGLAPPPPMYRQLQIITTQAPFFCIAGSLIICILQNNSFYEVPAC